MATWGLAQAKAKLSELVDKAVHNEPQQITKNGRPVAVVLSIEEWKRGQEQTRPRQNLAEFFQSSPLAGSGIDLRRSKDKPRRIEL